MEAKPNTTCDGCADDKALKKFAADYKLTKVDMLVDELEKMPVDTSAEKWRNSLINFKDSVVAKITAGSDKENGWALAHTPFM